MLLHLKVESGFHLEKGTERMELVNVYAERGELVNVYAERRVGMSP